jgi:hypothetical protein
VSPLPESILAKQAGDKEPTNGSTIASAWTQQWGLPGRHIHTLIGTKMLQKPDFVLAQNAPDQHFDRSFIKVLPMSRGQRSQSC